MEIRNVKDIKEFLLLANPIIKSNEYQRLKEFVHHGRFSVYSHSLHVAYFCYLKAKDKKNINMQSLIKAALLHDYFLYDWHYRIHRHGLHGYTHPLVAYKKAKADFGLTKKEANAIVAHMWPLTLFTFPRSKEAWIVCMMDKKSTNYEARFKVKKRKDYFQKKNNSSIKNEDFYKLITNYNPNVRKQKIYYYFDEENYGIFATYKVNKNTIIQIGLSNDLNKEIKFELASLIMKYSRGKRAYIFIEKRNEKLLEYFKELLQEKDEDYRYQISENQDRIKVYFDRKK